MPFGAILGAAAAKLGAGALGTAAAKAGGAVLGGAVTGGIDNYFSKKGAESGALIDRQSAIAQTKDRYQFYSNMGATTQEILGLGTGSTASGASATLGNAYSGNQALAMQQAFQASENEKDRAVQLRGQEVDLAKSQISAGASVQSAGISAAAQRYVAGVNKAIADQNLELADRQFRLVTLRESASRLGLDQQRLIILANDAVTSTPDYQLRKLMYSMGAENLMTSIAAESLGLDITDPEAIDALSKQELHDAIIYLTSIGSWSFRESAGGATVIEEGLQDLAQPMQEFLDYLLNLGGSKPY